ncbi:MAG TPA: aspartate aminotransferase family protein [Bdellovibrionota bacterium]|nr:aspartate aminotransferase family protein [Bdellovibrionota bacterium]
MAINVRELIEKRQGENYALHDRYINPTFAKVLKIIGFDRVYTRGEGAYLFDGEGNRYLDFVCGYGVFNLGRNHPAVKAALKEYLDLDYPNLVKMDAPLISGLLAEALVKRMPAGLDTVFFGNSGTEGVETALKFSHAASGRARTVYTAGAFHGLTYGSLSVNGDEHFRESFGPFLPGCDAVPFDDLDALDRALSTKDVGAFIVEPIQGKGVHVPGPDYLIGAQKLCRKYGTYFVVDEVQTGMGRTGRFLALEHWNLEPDLVIISKSLSGGQVPVSAVVGRRDIFLKVFSRLDRCVVHSTTFGQNAMAMAAGLAALHVLEEDRLVENADRMGNLLMEELRLRKDRYEFLKEVRGRGLLVGVEFGAPKSLKLKMAWNLLHKADAGLFAQAIIMPLLDKHHVLTQVAGHNMDVVKLAPALCVTEQDIRDFIKAFDGVMDDCHRLPGPIWEVGSRLAKHAVR